MPILVSSKGLLSARPLNASLTRFQLVLLAALKTRHYPPLLRAVGLGAPDAIRALGSTEEALARIPLLDGVAWRASLGDFENPDAPVPRPRPVRFPFDPAPRVVVLTAAGGIRRLRSRQAVAAPVGLLRSVARTIDRGAEPPAPLEHAIIAITGIKEGCLTDEDRDLFWRVFQVPAFEQYLGLDGQVMAAACEAHDGLHVLTENAIFESIEGELFLTSLTDLRHPTLRLSTGLTGALHRARCACGKDGPLLASLGQAVIRNGVALRATAESAVL